MPKKKEINEWVSGTTMAEMFGVTLRRIQQLTEDGTLTHTKIVGNARRYDLKETVREYVAALSDKAHGREKNATEVELKEQKLRAEIALKESQGELHRLKTEIATGEYISIEEAKADYQKFFVRFKAFAMTIPGMVIKVLGNSVEPVESKRIETEVHDALVKALRKMVESMVVEGGEEKEGRTNKGS